MNRKRTGQWILMCILMICSVCFVHQGSIQGKANAKTNQITIRVLQGTRNAVKIGCETVLQMELTNETEEDFAGTLQIQYIASQGKDAVSYEQEISIKKQESIRIEKNILINQRFEAVWVGVRNSKNEIVGDHTQQISVFLHNKSILGTLSGEYALPECFKSNNFIQYAYTTMDFPSNAKTFSGMELCYVQPAQMTELSEQQVNALQEWVQEGGTLIERIEPDMAGVTDPGWIIAEGTDPQMTAYVQKQGKGSRIIFSEKVYEGEGLEETKKFCNRIFREYGGEAVVKTRVAGSDYVYGEGIVPVCDVKFYQTIDLTVFIIILVVYVMLISFGVYFVLKKKDKAIYAWAVIPVLAVVCSLVIYIAGGKTRTTENYLNYVSYVEYDKERDTGKKVTNLAVTFLNDKAYTLELPLQSNVAMLYEEEEIYSPELTEETPISVQTGEKSQILKMSSKSAFSNVAVQIQEEAEKKGMVEGTITCENNSYTGELINNTDSKLKDVFLMVAGKIYWLGDLEKGEKYTFEREQPEDAYLDVDSINYIGDCYGVGSEIENGNFDTEKDWQIYDNGIEKYYTALRMYLENSNFYYQAQKGIVMGIQEQTDITNEEQWGIVSGGFQLCIYNIEVNYTNQNGETYVPNVLTRCMEAEHMVDPCRNVLTSDTQNGNILTFALNKNTRLTGLYYAEENSFFEKRAFSYDSFHGVLKIWNVKTGKYEPLELGGNRILLENPEDYVNEKAEIRFMLDNPDWEHLPIISATVQEVQ